VLLVGVPAGFGVVALSRLADDISLTADGDGGDAQADPGQGPAGEDVEVVPPDLAELEGSDAALAQVLIDVDRAEREMMAVQDGFREVFADVEGDDVEGALDELSSVAGDGQRELQDIRRDLTAPVEGGQIRAVRDRYLAHLDAWVRYLVAVEEDPTVLAGGAGEEAFTLAIDTTGDAFAREVRENLPEGVDERVRAFALQIVERGFAGGATSDADV
jgi:hypothetical protein